MIRALALSSIAASLVASPVVATPAQKQNGLALSSVTLSLLAPSAVAVPADPQSRITRHKLSCSGDFSDAGRPSRGVVYARTSRAYADPIVVVYTVLLKDGRLVTGERRMSAPLKAGQRLTLTRVHAGRLCYASLISETKPPPW